jgi:hypothetical protein
MAGGIFEGRPFNWNIKCIIFTAVVASGYWYLPSKSMWVLILLLWLPYVALAWYDYAYDCNDIIMPTLFPLGRKIFLPFKSPGYKAEFEKLPADQIKRMDELDHLVTWTLLIAGIFYLAVYRQDY